MVEKFYVMTELDETDYIFETQNFPILSGLIVEKARLGYCAFDD